MPDFGVYSEEAIRRLDLAMVAAAENGIWVMGNHWPFLGTRRWLIASNLINRAPK
jgi:hypothetical protein